MKYFWLLLSLLLVASPVWSATIYVDQTTIDCTGDYSIAARTCSGSDGDSWSTVQEAVTAVSVGDVIYMRGGTYTEYNIAIPNTHRGTAWTEGNFYALESYPGEWAVFSGSGTQDAVFTHALGYGEYQKRSLTNETSYWKFSRFEITGFAVAFWFSGGPQWFKYLYLHDNTTTNPAFYLGGAIFVTLPHDTIIEYNYFFNNDQDSPSNEQYGHIVFDADYRDDELPTTFDPDVCTKNNTIRYNHMVDSRWGLHYKNQQRFGTDTRVPATVASTYGDWGDEIHHNIITTNTRNNILCDQDNCQVYNNILDGSNYGSVQFSQEVNLSADNAFIYNGVAYNNTVIQAGKSFGIGAGPDPASSAPTGWFYNNISDQNKNADAQGYPFTIAADMNSATYASLSAVYISNNLIHSNTASNDLLRGRNDLYTLASAETTFGTVSDNWTNSTAGLFSSGYLTDGTFVIGADTIADGGVLAGGNAHPYLAGVTLPTYVGATNPSDNDWAGAAGVSAMNVAYFTSQTSGSDPTWIEAAAAGGGGSGLTGPGSGQLLIGPGYSGSFQ